eukprot:Gb_12353 [translate_table: standard]
MMGRGAEGGCGAEGNPCRIQNVKLSARNSCGKSPSVENVSGKKLDDHQSVWRDAEKMGMDVFTQALKAFAVKPPVEVDDGIGIGSVSGGPQFSAKFSGAGDGRRKHRKIQSRGHDVLSGSKAACSTKSRDGKYSKIWVEMEDYFRAVTAEDVMALIPRTQINVSLGEVSDTCMLIPPPGIYYRGSQLNGNQLKLDEDSELGKAESAKDRVDVKRDMVDELSKAEDEQDTTDVTHDQKDLLRGETGDEFVSADIGQGFADVREDGADAERAVLVSPKQLSSDGRIAMAEPSMQESTSKNFTEAVPAKQESRSDTTLAAVMTQKESVAAMKLAEVGSSKQESSSGTKLVAEVSAKSCIAEATARRESSYGTKHPSPVSPKQESNSGTKIAALTYPNHEECFSPKLPLDFPEQELSSGTKVSVAAFSPKRESCSGEKLIAAASHEEESNSTSKLKAVAFFPKQEPTSGAKRKLLAASLCSKKKKLSASSAEVITTVISPPENEEELCHVCYGGDSEEWNQILFCDACDVAVHQECYGVQEIPDGQWLCSWCSYMSRSLRKGSAGSGSGSSRHKTSNGGLGSDARPCILCPRHGGALKPIAREALGRENNGYLQFAHLFCCQWVPETYIENTETMEPIKNTEGIKEARWRLLCSLCKEKHGACIQCSHGMCATAFHPLCARGAKLRMGISCKEGSDDVDLWAFCPKHSFARVSRASSSRNGSVDGLSEAEVIPSIDTVISHSSDETCTDQENQLSLKDTADKGIEIKVYDLVQSSFPVAELASGSSKKTLLGSRKQPKTGDVLQAVPSVVECSEVAERGNLDVSGDIEEGNFFNLIKNLRKAVERRQVSLTDVATQMGVPSSLLATLIQDNKCKISSDLQRKISAWLCTHGFVSTTVHESEPATEQEKSLGTETSDQDELTRAFVQTRRRRKNKKRLPKATLSDRDCTLVETVSSLCKERAENDVVMNELSSQQNVGHGNELDMGLQDEKNSGQDKSAVQITDVENVDEVGSIKEKRIDHLIMKDFKQCSLDLDTPLESSAEVRPGHLDDGRRLKESQQEAESDAAKASHRHERLLTVNKAGSGASTVDGDRNSKHGLLEVQAAMVSDSKELGPFGDREPICTGDPSKGCLIGEEPDAKMQRYGSCLNFEKYQVENYRDIVTRDKDIQCTKKSPDSYVHQFIQKRLAQIQCALASAKGEQKSQSDGHVERDANAEESCLMEQEMDPTFFPSNIAPVSKDFQWKQLMEARKRGVLDFSPEDDLEGEIVFLQHILLEYAQANHYRSESLILRVITNLSEEQKALRRQRLDAVLVSEYLSQAREAKKQGRKERRHKEAQAILAAATAAAAASPRVGSSRKDGLGDAVEEHGHQVSYPSKPSLPIDWGISKTGFSTAFPTSQPMKESLQKHLKGNIPAGRLGPFSQTMLRAKETLSRPIVAKVSSERPIDAWQLPPGSPKEESILCDICRLQESTRANKINVCRHCKVAVHQDCYGISKVTFGGWYCQPCEELRWQYQGMRLPAVVARGRPGCGVECALCGGLSGAFKKTTDGHWVHVFCAEWMLENMFRRGQMDPVGGLEEVPKERYTSICSICHLQQGACLKCNFGHCHNAFHPLCARDFGLYMPVISHGGKVQYKAYCEKHSQEQRIKAESRRCGGSEELKIIKQMRVELERVRLICERIVRREKLKDHDQHHVVSDTSDNTLCTVLLFLKPSTNLRSLRSNLMPSVSCSIAHIIY